MAALPCHIDEQKHISARLPQLAWEMGELQPAEQQHPLLPALFYDALDTDPTC